MVILERHLTLQDYFRGTSVWFRNMNLSQTTEKELGWLLCTRLLRPAITISLRDKAAQEDLFGELPKVTGKVSDFRLSAGQSFPLLPGRSNQ